MCALSGASSFILSANVFYLEAFSAFLRENFQKNNCLSAAELFTT